MRLDDAVATWSNAIAPGAGVGLRIVPVGLTTPEQTMSGGACDVAHVKGSDERLVYVLACALHDGATESQILRELTKIDGISPEGVLARAALALEEIKLLLNR